MPSDRLKKGCILLLFLLVFMDLTLALIYLFGPKLSLSPLNMKLFNLDGERNIPSYFSSLQLLMIGLSFFLISREPAEAFRPFVSFFMVIAAGFCFLAFDEAMGIHEKITHATVQYEWVPRFKGNHGVWIFAYSMIAAAFIVYFAHQAKQLLKLCEFECRMFLLGGAVLVAGAVGMEILSYLYLRGTPGHNFLYRLEVTAEEFMEMAGASIMLYSSLLLAFKTRAVGVRAG